MVEELLMMINKINKFWCVEKEKTWRCLESTKGMDDISGDLLFGKRAVYFFITITCFKEAQDCVLQSGPPKGVMAQPMQKATRKK